MTSILNILEIPTLPRKDYIKLREGLPYELRKILDEAYLLDREIDALRRLVAALEKVNVVYITKVIERFSKLAADILVYYRKYLTEDKYARFKDEVNKFMKCLMAGLTRLREPSYNAAVIIISLKLFIYTLVYIPLRKMKEDMNRVIIERFAKHVESCLGLLPEPSEIIKEAR